MAALVSKDAAAAGLVAVELADLVQRVGHAAIGRVDANVVAGKLHLGVAVGGADKRTGRVSHVDGLGLLGARCGDELSDRGRGVKADGLGGTLRPDPARALLGEERPALYHGVGALAIGAGWDWLLAGKDLGGSGRVGVDEAQLGIALHHADGIAQRVGQTCRELVAGRKKHGLGAGGGNLLGGSVKVPGQEPERDGSLPVGRHEVDDGHVLGSFPSTRSRGAGT